jgi:hypothetical protein
MSGQLASRSGLFNRMWNPTVSIGKEAGSIQSRSGCSENYFSLSSAVQLVARRYTDWAIPARAED